MDLPSDEGLRWLVSRYASLRAEHGEGIGDPPLVTPTPEDFPDAFELSVEGVGRFLTRMLEYAPVAADLDVRLRVVEGEGGAASCGTGGCGTSACGPTEKKATFGDRVIDADDAYIVELPSTAAAHPTRLAATLARSVGTIVLLEAGEELLPDEVGPMSELAATASGLGVLLLEGSHVFAKSCGGVRVEQCTHLGVSELAVLVALFVRLHDRKLAQAKAHLATTQSEALGEAVAWVDSNEKLLGNLDQRPEMLTDGVFAIEPVKGLLGRWFSSSRKAKVEKLPSELAPLSPCPRAPRSAEEQRRIDEARALVDAALGGAETSSR